MIEILFIIFIIIIRINKESNGKKKDNASGTSQGCGGFDQAAGRRRRLGCDTPVPGMMSNNSKPIGPIYLCETYKFDYKSMSLTLVRSGKPFINCAKCNSSTNSSFYCSCKHLEMCKNCISVMCTKHKKIFMPNVNAVSIPVNLETFLNPKRRLKVIHLSFHDQLLDGHHYDAPPFEKPFVDKKGIRVNGLRVFCSLPRLRTHIERKHAFRWPQSFRLINSDMFEEWPWNSDIYEIYISFLRPLLLSVIQPQYKCHQATYKNLLTGSYSYGFCKHVYKAQLGTRSPVTVVLFVETQRIGSEKLAFLCTVYPEHPMSHLYSPQRKHHAEKEQRDRQLFQQ